MYQKLVITRDACDESYYLEHHVGDKVDFSRHYKTGTELVAGVAFALTVLRPIDDWQGRAVQHLKTANESLGRAVGEIGDEGDPGVDDLVDDVRDSLEELAARLRKE